MAYRLGVLREYRRMAPDVISDIARGLDFYDETFQHPDYFLQPVIEYTLKDGQ